MNSESSRRPYADRRAFVRHRCVLDSSCVPTDTDDTGWPAQIQDISQGGAALLLKAHLETDTPIYIQLPWPGGGSRSIPARVVYSRDRSGQWLVGCDFVLPLSTDELAGILDIAATPESR
jgi:hypothetical protein